MSYLELRKIFHADRSRYERVLEERKTSDDAIYIGVKISSHPAFFVMTSEVYRLEMEAVRLDKEILKLVLSLPGKAIKSYMEACLIDEIVLTNEIEGVNSTRREIGDVLERLAKNDKRGRFRGLVQKYLMLSSGQRISVESCENIRAIYNDLVLEEVMGANKEDVPDGKLFRRGPVSVCDSAGIPIHQGVEPEAKIISYLESALLVLNNVEIPPLAKISAFHFLFGYIHPFYDGNGRTNRFISSCMMSKNYEPLVGFRLSYSVKQEINKYYKAYSTCEHKLNGGDITPFVLAFSEIIVRAMNSMRDSLAERRQRLEECNLAIDMLVDAGDNTASMAQALSTAALFSPHGITAIELGKAFDISRQTVYKRMEPLRASKLILSEKIGVKTFYKLDTGKVLSLYQKLRTTN